MRSPLLLISIAATLAACSNSPKPAQSPLTPAQQADQEAYWKRRCAMQEKRAGLCKRRLAWDMQASQRKPIPTREVGASLQVTSRTISVAGSINQADTLRREE